MNTRRLLRKGLVTVGFMWAVTLVYISAISLTYLSTRDRIRRNERLALQTGVLQAAGLAVPSRPADIIEQYARHVREVSATGPFTILDEAEDRLGRVVLTRGAGLWGTIVAAVGLDDRDGRLLGITFLEHNETPGLGARISEDWFRGQFVGKRPPLTMASRDATEKDDAFEAITGATVTSTAVRDMLNALAEDGPPNASSRKRHPVP